MNLEYPLLLQRPAEKLTAVVARVCEEGAGVAWSEFAPRTVVELLQTMTSVRPHIGSAAHRSIQS